VTRIVYVNGRYWPYAAAQVHAEDRGFQFADAVYEVCEVRGGRLIDETRHMRRLARSLAELGMPQPLSPGAWSRVLRETVSRGAQPRNFTFPDAQVRPTVVCLARATPGREAAAGTGIAVTTAADIRWARRDIKTVMLLPSVLAKEAAKAAGAEEAWLVDAEGFVTEGASSNAWIVDPNGRLITRQIDQAILSGITRATLIDLLKRENIELIERRFSVAEAKAAREAFVTSATNIVMPVVAIDGVPIGNGAPGLLTLRLRAQFHAMAEVGAP